MTASPPSHVPNPNRVAAGRRNRQLRKGLTPKGLATLRATALGNQPWKHSTGPRTAAGKAKSAANGRLPSRAGHATEIAAHMAELQQLMTNMAGVRRDLQAQLGGKK